MLLPSTCPALLQHLLPQLSTSEQVSFAQDMCLQYYHNQTHHGAVIGLATVFKVQLSREEILLSRLVPYHVGSGQLHQTCRQKVVELKVFMQDVS